MIKGQKSVGFAASVVAANHHRAFGVRPAQLLGYVLHQGPQGMGGIGSLQNEFPVGLLRIGVLDGLINEDCFQKLPGLHLFRETADLRDVH